MVLTMEIHDQIASDGGLVVEGNVDVELLNQGLLIRAEVGGLSVLERGLSFQELGLRPDDDATNWMKAGVRNYAPGFDRRIKSWGVQCRQAVQRYCMDLESIKQMAASRSWRFLHFDAYPRFRERWDELQQERQHIIRDFERERESLVEEAQEFYIAEWAEAWDILQSRYAGAVQVGNSVVFQADEREAYLAWVRDHVEEDFPTVQELREKLFSRYITFNLFSTDSLAQAAAEQAEAELRQTRAQDEAWRIATTRQERETAIRQAELERARQTMAELPNPLQEAMENLVAELGEHVGILMKGFNEHGSFRGRSLERIDRMREVIQVMGGRNLKAHDDIQRVLDLADSHRATNGATAEKVAEDIEQLGEIVRAEGQRLERLSQLNTRASALEL